MVVVTSDVDMMKVETGNRFNIQRPKDTLESLPKRISCWCQCGVELQKKRARNFFMEIQFHGVSAVMTGQVQL